MLTEHDEQKAFVRWFRIQPPKVKIFAIPNGGHRHIKVAQKLKAEGVSAGHGLNLQHGGNILVFYSDSWALEPHLQIIERIGPMRQKQAGLNRPVFVHYIVVKDSIDLDVLESHRTKKSLQDLVLERLRNVK